MRVETLLGRSEDVRSKDGAWLRSLRNMVGKVPLSANPLTEMGKKGTSIQCIFLVCLEAELLKGVRKSAMSRQRLHYFSTMCCWVSWCIIAIKRSAKEDTNSD